MAKSVRKRHVLITGLEDPPESPVARFCKARDADLHDKAVLQFEQLTMQARAKKTARLAKKLLANQSIFYGFKKSFYFRGTGAVTFELRRQLFSVRNEQSILNWMQDVINSSGLSADICELLWFASIPTISEEELFAGCWRTRGPTGAAVRIIQPNVVARLRYFLSDADVQLIRSVEACNFSSYDDREQLVRKYRARKLDQKTPEQVAEYILSKIIRTGEFRL